MPFDTLATRILTRAFSHQASDGGLPETFPGTPSGCWTSAELYAAICEFGLEPLCPTGSIDRLEEWLLACCEQSGGQGLPHYPSIRGGRYVVEASACLVMGLNARRPGHPAIDRVCGWLAESQRPSGGWGVGDGETERVYSTGYAVMALSGTAWAKARARGREWLVAQRRVDGTWPVRPGVGVPAWTATQIASAALGVGADSPLAGPITAHLLAGAELERMLEEDEFPTRDGWKMTFAYAPRLVCIGGALSLARTDRDAAVSRLLRALARYELDATHDRPPVVDASGERLWHTIDFAWGYGMTRGSFSRLGNSVRERYADEVAATRIELGRRTIMRQTVPPIAALARRLWLEDEGATDQLATLAALTETTCRVVRARVATELATIPAGAALVDAALAEPASGAGRTLWSLSKQLAKLAPASALVRDLQSSGSALRRWLDRRNDAAHRPPSTPSGRSKVVRSWDALTLEVLTSLTTLHDLPLYTLEEVALPAGGAAFRYRVRAWIGTGQPHRDEILDSDRRLADRVVLTVEGAPPQTMEARTVYVGKLSAGGASLREISPFVLRAPCSQCSTWHFFLFDGARAGTADVIGVVAGECGALMNVRWPGRVAP